MGSYLQHCHELQQQQQQQPAYVKVQNVLHTSNISTPEEAIPFIPPCYAPNQMSPRVLRVLLPPESISSIERLSTPQPRPCIPKPEKRTSPPQPSPESVLDLFPLPANGGSCQEHNFNITASTHNVILPQPLLFTRPNLLKLDLTPKPVQPTVHAIAPPLTFGDILVDIDLPVYSAQLQLDYLQAPQNGHTPLSNGKHPTSATQLQPQRNFSPTPAAASLTPQGPRSVFKRDTASNASGGRCPSVIQVSGHTSCSQQ